MSDTSVTAGTSTARRGLRADARFLVQVSRPGLWSTTALFYLLPLGHGAFTHSGRLWLGLLFVLFPLGLLLYGVNDLADAEADQLNPRKGTYMFGSRGSREQLAALKWQIVVAQLPFLAAFLLLVGPRILGWYGILLLAVGIYNAPRFGWLNNTPQLPWQTFLFGALFAMHSHVFGEVMDIEPDHLSGRKTTATVIGRVTAKFLIVALLGVETLLVRLYFHDWIVAGFLALGAGWFALDATLVWKDRKYRPKQMRLFLWGWNIAALLGIFWNWAQSSLTHLP